MQTHKNIAQLYHTEFILWCAVLRYLYYYSTLHKVRGVQFCTLSKPTPAKNIADL